MSTGATTAIGIAKQQRAITRHGYYGKMLAKHWSPEKLAAYEAAPRSTNCADEIALIRANIQDIDRRLTGGEISVPGMRGEVFLEDIRDRLLGRLNGFLRSQHEMHPEAEMGNNRMRLEITVKGADDVDVKNLDDGVSEPTSPEATQEEKEDAVKETALDKLLGDDP